MCIGTAASASSVSVRAPDELVRAAHLAADASGEVIRGYFRGGELSTRLKADESPVSAADVGAEAAIRRVLERTGKPVVGEEGGGDGKEMKCAEWAWVVDPIDGTKAFVSGRPTFGTLIAILHRGAPVYGLIDQPISGERWSGGGGRPTALCGTPMRVRSAASTSTRLADVLVHATTPDMFVGADFKRFQAIKNTSQGAVYGADCYAYAMLASGCVDLVVEADLKIWDFMALVPVVQAAGGVMCDWNGQPLGPESDGRVIAACSVELLNETLNVIRSIDDDVLR